MWGGGAAQAGGLEGGTGEGCGVGDMLPVRPQAIACPQGMPGKDGRDGVPGQDGEKVGTWPVAWKGGGVCGEFSLLGLSTPSPLDLPQGEAGRNGAPGEKGPSGLPVSAWGSHGAGAAVDAPTQGISRGPWLGLVQGSLRKEAPQPLGFPASSHALPRGLGSSDSWPLSCRVSPDEQGPRVRRENW